MKYAIKSAQNLDTYSVELSKDELDILIKSLKKYRTPTVEIYDIVKSLISKLSRY